MRERLENESERLAARENERVRTRVIESKRHRVRAPFDSRILYIFLKARGPWLLPLLLMQSRGDVTYDASCNRATWSVDGRDFEDSERFLIGWACWIDSWPKPRNLAWSHDHA